jgi:hypothetical protein
VGSAIVVLTLIATLTRIPVSRGDGPFYASIARSYHYGIDGIPSTLLPEAPTGVDHVRFYGPVYFRTVSALFAVFGVSVAAFRAVNLFGVMLFAAAGVFVCRALGGGPNRRAWTWLLLLLTPEAGTASSSGRMDSLAVGLEMCGFAILLEGIVKQTRPKLYGIASGVLLSTAALTTPRTFPFLFGLAIAAIVEHWRAPSIPRAIRVQGAVTAITGVTIFLLWTTLSSGGPLPWLRFMAYVATHENTDVALLPSATVRDLMFTWWQSVTLAFSVVGALVAAYLMRDRDDTAQALAGSFALVTTWTTLVATMTLFNYTFVFGMYFVLPLTAVVIALPTPLSDVRRRGAAFVAVMLLVVLAGVRAGKVVHAGITWDARDPANLDGFVANHVPPGSRVLGPGPDFFFAVEGAGSRYISVPQVSLADWSRWVRPPDRPAPPPVPPGDFLLWRNEDGPPPPPVACAIRRLVATYEPPPPNIASIAWVTKTDPFAEYPVTALYALGSRCGLY